MGVLGVFLKIVSTIFTVVPVAIRVANAVADLLKPGEKTGPAKMAAVKAMVMSAIEGAEIITNRDLVDNTLLDQGITEVTEGTLKILKAAHAE